MVQNGLLKQQKIIVSIYKSKGYYGKQGFNKLKSLNIYSG